MMTAIQRPPILDWSASRRYKVIYGWALSGGS
jgi:hypothetical protein